MRDRLEEGSREKIRSAARMGDILRILQEIATAVRYARRKEQSEMAASQTLVSDFGEIHHVFGIAHIAVASSLAAGRPGSVDAPATTSGQNGIGAGGKQFLSRFGRNGNQRPSLGPPTITQFAPTDMHAAQDKL